MVWCASFCGWERAERVSSTDSSALMRTHTHTHARHNKRRLARRLLIPDGLRGARLQLQVPPRRLRGKVINAIAFCAARRGVARGDRVAAASGINRLDRLWVVDRAIVPPRLPPNACGHPDQRQALYRPGLEGEALVRLACQCLRAGLERDCASGYGLLAYLITPHGIRRTVVQGRMD